MRSTTEEVYEWLTKHAVGTQITTTMLQEVTGRSQGACSGSLNFLEKHGVVKPVGKVSRLFVYEYLGPSGSVSFKAGGLGRVRSPALVAKKGTKIRKLADFGISLPGLTEKQKEEVVEQIQAAGLEKPKSLVDRLLEILVEIEELEARANK